MNPGLIITQADPETVFNALRLANYSLAQGDAVQVFLLGKGVELDRIEGERFHVREQAEALLQTGGRILACGTCLKLRLSGGSELCPWSSMKDLHDLVRDSDRIPTI